MTNTADFTGNQFLEEESKVLEDYVIGQRLGEGSYGSVYIVTYIPSGEKFALKILRKDDLFAPALAMMDCFYNSSEVNSPLMRSDTNFASPVDSLATPLTASSPLLSASQLKLLSKLEKKIVQEATVLQSLNHPHVVNFFKFFNSTVAFYFITELAEGGELFDLIISKGHFSENEARHYFQQLISAIDYCHRQGVAHKDLKAENLLLGKDNCLLVCDFGFSSKNASRNMDDPNGNIAAGDVNMMLPDNADNGLFGTLHYMSPEAVAASTANDRDEAGDFAYGGSNYGHRDNSTNPLEGNTVAAGHSGDSPQTTPTIPGDSDYFNSFTSNTEAPFLKENTERQLGSDHLKKNTSADYLDSRSPRSPVRQTNLANTTSNSAGMTRNPNSATSTNNNSIFTTTDTGNNSKKEHKVTGFVKSIFGEKGLKNTRSSMTLDRSSSSSDEEERRSHRHHGHRRRHHNHNNNGKMNNKEKNKNNNNDTLTPSITSPYVLSPNMRVPPHHRVQIDPFMQDLWSAGVILFFMLTGRLPFDGRDDEETMHLIEEGQFNFEEEEIERISPQTRQFVARMLRRDPNDRLSMEEIIHDKWFTTNLNPEDFPHRDDIEEIVGDSGSCTNRDSFLNFSNKNHAITPEEENIIAMAFSKTDVDGYGKITRDQLRDILIVLHGDAVPAGDVSELVSFFTGNPNSDDVSFQQFRNAWVNKDLANQPFAHKSEFQLANIVGTQVDEVERQIVRQLRKAFDSVDSTHAGFITFDELKGVFEKCNIPVSQEDLSSLMTFFLDQNLVIKPSFPSSKGSSGHSAVPSTPCSPSKPNSKTGISFDAFVLGIVKREILLFHPLGRKLATATNLASLFNIRNVSECVRHGFLVLGLQNVVLDKLTNVPERLLLLYSDEVISSTENIYSFRYLGSSALVAGMNMEAAVPTLASSASTPCPARLASSSSGFHGDNPLPGAASVNRRELARSLRHFSYSTSAFERNSLGSLSGPVSTIADLNRSIRVATSAIKSSRTKSRSKKTKVPNSAVSQSIPISTNGSPGGAFWDSYFCRSEFAVKDSCEGSPHLAQSVKHNGNTEERSLGSEDGASSYSSHRNSVSIVGTDKGSLTPPSMCVSTGSIAMNHQEEEKRQSMTRSSTDDAARLATLKASLKRHGQSTHQFDNGNDAGPKALATTLNYVPSDTLFASSIPVHPAGDLDKTTSISSQPLSPKGKNGSAKDRHSLQSKRPVPLSLPNKGKEKDERSKGSGNINNLSNGEDPNSMSGEDLQHLREQESLELGFSMHDGGVNEDGTPRLHRPPRHGVLSAESKHLFSASRSSYGRCDTPGCGGSRSGVYSHRNTAFSQGVGGASQINGVCDVDIILAPASLGYTLVRFRRIHGKTSDFHEAISYITNLLNTERQQAIEDTMPCGESELM